MRGSGLYLLASAGLGVVAGGVIATTLLLGAGHPMTWDWIHPVWLGGMVPAVVVAAWLVRPLLRGSRVQAAGAAAFMAMVTATLFGMVVCLADYDQPRMGALDRALAGGLLGAVACVVLGYVTFPLGLAFAWLLRRVLRRIDATPTLAQAVPSADP